MLGVPRLVRSAWLLVRRSKARSCFKRSLFSLALKDSEKSRRALGSSAASALSFVSAAVEAPEDVRLCENDGDANSEPAPRLPERPRTLR